jgi:RNA polymerase sigma-70 factor (ECF subfamily)
MQQASTDSGNDRVSGLFPETLWTVVLGAKASDPKKARAALSELCQVYRKPIVNWLRFNGCKEEAEDLASAFILRWHERNHLVDFEPQENAKFRSFLLTCLRRFVNDERKKAGASKRNDGVAPVPLEDHDVPQSAEAGRKLDRDIAGEIHGRVVESLAHRDPSRFAELRPFLFGLDRSGSYSQAAAKLGTSEGAVNVAVCRLREKYYDAFRAETAHIARPDELDEEMRYLVGLVSETE